MNTALTQRGAALLIAVLLLAALGLLGLVSAGDAQLQQRLAAQTIEDERTMMQAELVLASAESWLMKQPAGTRPEPCSGVCGHPVRERGALPLGAERGDPAWWIGNGHDANEMAGRFVIEERLLEPSMEGSADTWRAMYRVLAWYRDPVRPEPVLLESILLRRWGPDVPACGEPEQSRPCGRLGWRRLR